MHSPTSKLKMDNLSEADSLKEITGPSLIMQINVNHIAKELGLGFSSQRIYA